MCFFIDRVCVGWKWWLLVLLCSDSNVHSVISSSASTATSLLINEQQSVSVVVSDAGSVHAQQEAEHHPLVTSLERARHDWSAEHHQQLHSLHSTQMRRESGQTYPLRTSPVQTHGVRFHGHHWVDGEKASLFHNIRETKSSSNSDRDDVEMNNATEPGTTTADGPAGSAAAAPVLISFAVLVGFFIFQLGSLATSERRPPEPAPAADTGGTDDYARPERSMTVIVLLTSYKFYMGFLNATWMPFLLAREGSALAGNRQTVFMGSEKLIYGLSMFMNPFLGLLSDKLSSLSPSDGRVKFVLAGVVMECFAICGARVSSDSLEMGWYVAATVSWMLGEALIDVVVEAMPPLILPPSQYSVASAIRSLQFFFGGFLGYVMLLIMYKDNHKWLYSAYALLMLVCSVPTLFYARVAEGIRIRDSRIDDLHGLGVVSLLKRAYVSPLYIPGCFPRACLFMFVTVMGTAPMFYTLLMVRDIIGTTSESMQQLQFGGLSLVFLMSAIVGAYSCAPSSADNADSGHDTRSLEFQGLRWTLMIYWVIAYGVATAASPLVAFATDPDTRLRIFAAFVVLLGLSFGNLYSRFKECVWLVLPAEGIDIANTMGFSNVAQISGTGIGNCMMGLILDRFRKSDAGKGIGLMGYMVSAWWCSALVFLGAYLSLNMMREKGLPIADWKKLIY